MLTRVGSSTCASLCNSGTTTRVGGIALAQEADRLGFHSVWTSEAYGTDAVTPMAWIAATTERIAVGSAIMQMPARSPAATATTVATLDILSGGRVLLGLGTSGPQVAEGWHGQPWGKPLDAHPRVRRDRPHDPAPRGAARAPRRALRHPLHAAPDATGLGKPLKIIVHPARARGADLPGGDRAEERRAHGRDRRRLAADLLLARAGARRARPRARGGLRAPRRPARGLGSRAARARS